MRKLMTRVFDEVLGVHRDVVYIGEDVEHGGCVYLHPPLWISPIIPLPALYHNPLLARRVCLSASSSEDIPYHTTSWLYTITPY